MDRQALDLEYQRRLHAIGVPTPDVLQLMERVRQVNAALDAGDCPDCGRPVQEKHRVEPAPPDAAWYGYKCVCGFLATRIEPEN
jgi:hypothetical protein